MNDHLSVRSEALSVESKRAWSGVARPRAALLLWGAWVAGLMGCSTSETANNATSSGATGSTVATGSSGAGGSTTTSTGAAGSPVTVGSGSGGGTTGAGGGGGAGGGAGGAPPMGGGPCSTTAGTNLANLTVRRPEISTRRLGAVAAANVIRIDRDPLTGNIVYMNRAGRFWRVDPTTGTSTATETSYTFTGDHRSMAYGPDGALYTVAVPAGTIRAGTQIIATIRKGSPGPTRTWTTMATTAGYPASGTNFDHSFGGLVVSPDNQYLYFGSGSRSDHGEVEGTLREVPLTSAVFRLPITANNLTLANDETALAPYLFVDGTRNTFDFAWSADGELFGGDNGPDMDLPDEINVLRQGNHYGFPWRFGAEANPMLDPAYTPTGDTRLHVGFQGVDQNKYVYDPAFPAAPAGVTFVDAIPNHGPDLDKFRAGRMGTIQKASALGMTMPGITGHRSPLGLTFDAQGTLCGDYYKAGFVVSFGALIDVMQDGGQDLALVNLTKVGADYEMKVTQLVAGFTAPIDSVMVGNKIYIVEFAVANGGGSLYEITLPLAQ